MWVIHDLKGTSNMRQLTVTKISERVAAKLEELWLKSYIHTNSLYVEDMFQLEQNPVCNFSQPFNYFPIAPEKQCGPVVCPLKY
jgi:hypothetical protein